MTSYPNCSGANNGTAALIENNDKELIGIVTDYDLKSKMLAQSLELSTPVKVLMHTPIYRISDQALVYEALMVMENKETYLLAVENQNGKITQVIDYKSLVPFQHYGHLVLSNEIRFAKSTEDVIKYCAKAPYHAKTLFASSVRSSYVTDMLSSVCDSATVRLIELAIEELVLHLRSLRSLGWAAREGRKQPY